MAKQKDKLSIFIMIFFIVFGVFGVRKSILQRTQEQDLMESFEITEGRFVDCGVGKAADFGQYSFTLNGKVYHNSFQVDKFCFQITPHFCTKLKDYKFPVVYNPENPELNQMLVSKRDFGKYSVVRVDSLSRVFERYFDCR